MRSLALVLIVLAPAAFAATPTTTPAQRFHALVKQAWQQRQQNNSGWGNPSVQHEQRVRQETQENLATLKKINANELDPADQLTYRLFAYQLEDRLAGNAQPDAVQGMITQLWGPQLMAGSTKQLDFKTAADYRKWIKRLQGFGDYLDAFTKRLKQGIAKGITQPRVVMQRVPAEIKGAIAKDPTQSGFYYPFKHMPDTIPAAEQTKLRGEAKQAITNVVNPAYEKFLKFFKNDYLPHARTKVGVSALPGGKAYYRYLVKHFTTTDMTPKQVHALGLKLVAQIHGRMETLFKKIGFKGSYQDFLHYLRTNPRFYYKNPKALLEAYRAATKRVDPNLVKIAGTWLLPRVPYGVRPIPAALAPNTYPAYSVPPAENGSVAGYVGVNLYKPKSRPKYAIQVLMCHEGRPGHQLQIPIADELHNLPPF
ncbi:MAG: DUF885 domain-containing protein, partial [Gammaproteobacteria bacterium]